MKILFLSVVMALSAIFNVESKISQIITVDSILNDSTNHPLKPLMAAIMTVESKGNPKAYNKKGDCVGLLQITKICVRECNNILKTQKSSKRYSYEDRWDAEKSIEMFYIIQDKHNPTYDINKGIRLWNKFGWYKKKVLKVLKEQKIKREN